VIIFSEMHSGMHFCVPPKRRTTSVAKLPLPPQSCPHHRHHRHRHHRHCAVTPPSLPQTLRSQCRPAAAAKLLLPPPPPCQAGAAALPPQLPSCCHCHRPLHHNCMLPPPTTAATTAALPPSDISQISVLYKYVLWAHPA
jgi:hypothetical protein